MGIAYNGSLFLDTESWLPVRRNDADMGATLTALFASHRPYFNDIVTFDAPAPANSLSLFEWARPATLTSLLASYSDHIYRDHPDRTIESRPLKSLWAQWYLGLLVPPLMMAALCENRALDINPAAIRTDFHQTGRAAHFWIEAQEDRRLSRLNGEQRLAHLWQNVVAPVIAVLERSGDINGKLIWSNTGYLVNWFLGELRPLLGEQQVQALRHTCFMARTLSDGSDNPLFRTMIVRENLPARRTCCQRNRLPGVQQCGDCTLDR